MRPHGTFSWNELASTDAAKAKDFYASVLGWEFDAFELPNGAYWIARMGEQVVGGIGGLETGPEGTTASAWVSWIEVDDVDARVERARFAGGEVIEEPHDVPAVGRTAVLRDPTGALIGLLQGASE